MIRPLLFLLVCSLVAAVAASASTGASSAGGVKNAGFEAGIAGWKNTGTAHAAVVETEGEAGKRALTHSARRVYTVTTTQTVSGLQAAPSYTLGAWVKRSSGRNPTTISLSCGGAKASTFVPASPIDWLHIVVSAPLTGSSCTIALTSKNAAGNQWSRFDDITLAPGDTTLPIRGADISSLQKSEALGGVYRDASGKPADALKVLHDHGLNWIRLRVFVNSPDGFTNKPRLLEMAKRAQALGINVLVDLHYSDFWADPGKQWTPAEWQGKPFPQLLQTFTAYTSDIVSSLVAQGTPPAMVQIGNEINSGILWDYASTWAGTSAADDGFGNLVGVGHTTNWPQLAQLLKAGYDAVKAASPTTKVMLHLANAGDDGGFHWFFDNLGQALSTLGLGDAHHLPCDVIGMSYYPYWHGTFADMQTTIADVVQTYGKDVVIAETAYAFTTQDGDGTTNNVPGPYSKLTPGYPATPAGQDAMFRDVISVVRGVPGGHGLGVFYWDATWTPVQGNGWAPNNPASGNAWENQALFDFNGKPLPAMDEFRS